MAKKITLIILLSFVVLLGCCNKSKSLPEDDNNSIDSNTTIINTENELPECFELDDVLRDFDIELVDCPAGSFLMGDTSIKKEGGLIHKVTLSKPFRIGKYEVTERQLETFIGKKTITSELSGYYHSKNPQRYPGICTWKEANQFCQKLNSRFADYIPKGYHFDLPTEAQWEYACRAGTTTDLNNGKNLTARQQRCPNLDLVGWYIYNSEIPNEKLPCGYNNEIHHIGEKQPNNWGIFDMHGNVSEYCKDKFAPYQRKNSLDPLVLDGGHVVIRGGNAYSEPFSCCSSSRDSARTDSHIAGFRICFVSD